VTAQAPDIFIAEGKACPLLSTPLEKFFDSIDWRPAFRYGSTGNYRGYTARWEIIGRRLFLTGLFGADWAVPDHLAGKLRPDPDPFDDEHDGTKSLRLDDLFPKEAPTVEASWVTGRLDVATGPCLVYVHHGFASLYETYKVVNVVQGRVRQVRDFEGSEWARRSGHWWPDEEWFALSGNEELGSLMWSRRQTADREDKSELPDWRGIEDPWRRGALYDRAQERALECPCGAEPPRNRRPWRERQREAALWLKSGRMVSS